MLQFNYDVIYVARDINIWIKVLRRAGLIKEIRTNSVSIQKLNGSTEELEPQPLDCRSIALPLQIKNDNKK